MVEETINFRPIGVIHSVHNETAKTPIQPHYALGAMGVVEVFDEFAMGLQDVEGFSHIYLLYHFHVYKEARLLTKPFLQDIERGVFATRFPHRPNAIGLSVVELVARRGNFLDVKNVDILDGTPLLDIKPYIDKFDGWFKNTRNGWYEEVGG